MIQANNYSKAFVELNEIINTCLELIQIYSGEEFI